MSFNPDISKQAQEVIFSRKLKKNPHPPLMFNSNLVNKASSQRHLGIILDESLSFEEHSKIISVKTNKALYLLCKLQNLLPRAVLITLYKSFIRPYLDYGDIIYEQAFNSSFQCFYQRLCLYISVSLPISHNQTSKRNSDHSSKQSRLVYFPPDSFSSVFIIFRALWLRCQLNLNMSF